MGTRGSPPAAAPFRSPRRHAHIRANLRYLDIPPPGEVGQPRRLSGPTASVPSGACEAVKRDDLLVPGVARALRGAGSRRAEAAPRKGLSRAAASAPVIATRARARPETVSRDPRALPALLG